MRLSNADDYSRQLAKFLGTSFPTTHDAVPRRHYGPIIECSLSQISQLCEPANDNIRKAWSEFAGRLLNQAGSIGAGFQFHLTPELVLLTMLIYNLTSDNLKATIQSGADTFDNNTGAQRLIKNNLDLWHQLDLYRQDAPPKSPPLKAADEIIYAGLVDIFKKSLPPQERPAAGRHMAPRLGPSVFAQLLNLDLVMPSPLAELLKSYLVPEQGPGSPEKMPVVAITLSSDQWWLRAEEIFLEENSRRQLRDRWLASAHERRSCAGLGIFLEEMRRREPGVFQPLILDFFAAYDYCCRRQAANQADPFPLLTTISHLLQSPNPNLNRRGNRYFLKFRALLEIIATQGGLGAGNPQLTREFCFERLLPLTRKATIIGGSRQPHTNRFEFHHNV